VPVLVVQVVVVLVVVVQGRAIRRLSVLPIAAYRVS
jgi:hypothetical protein